MADTFRSSTAPTRFTLGVRRTWYLVALIAAIAAAAQFIGPAVIPIGFASITLLPMVWGLVAGAVASGQQWRPMGLDLQTAAAAIMGLGVLFLVARLAFTMGPNINVLLQAGPALLLQEVGHLFGTIMLALPLAVLLRMGPSTVGATFSIDREGSFAMVSERYGTESPQYRGVLSMYVFGTVFGAVLVGLLASLASSFGIFHPLALAMGAGVGSGSMMAAGAASVVSAHPEMKDQILAVAATSNLLTGALGLYVGMYVALPLADWLYRRLTGSAKAEKPVADAARPVAAEPARPVVVPLLTSLPVLFVVGVLTASIAKGFSWGVVGGYLVLVALIAIGVGASHLTGGKLSALIVTATLGVLLSTPVSPVAPLLIHLVDAVDFLTITTVVLTVAGLSLGKDLAKLRTIGWKIVPVGIVAISASYLVSVFIAQFALGL